MGGVYQNPRDREADKGRFGFDVTHNAVLNWAYEMPFLKHFRGGVRGFLLSGWQTNGILTMRTGFPFNLAGGNINTGSASRPDRLRDGRLGDKATRQNWFDTTAFGRVDCNICGHPELCHYGSLASGRSPYHTWQTMARVAMAAQSRVPVTSTGRAPAKSGTCGLPGGSSSWDGSSAPKH